MMTDTPRPRTVLLKTSLIVLLAVIAFPITLILLIISLNAGRR